MFENQYQYAKLESQNIEFNAVPLLWIIYVISVLFLLCFRARLFIDVLWSPAGKGLTSWLSFVMCYCEVLIFYWYPGSGVVLDLSIPDLCPLSYFKAVIEFFTKVGYKRQRNPLEHGWCVWCTDNAKVFHCGKVVYIIQT